MLLALLLKDVGCCVVIEISVVGFASGRPSTDLYIVLLFSHFFQLVFIS